ncbi:MAG TPA: metal ABC transporter substrate-binding protein [Longimicrobiales bacterium]|nr:metal ABC transporter substrate-binding protein [Longimicrobiales bacterium]
MNILALFSAAIVGVPSPGPGPIQAAPLRVVATLPVYAEIAKEIGGAQVEVSSIANPNEDAHFVRPKPSFALDLRRADVFINTGLDLELWVPTLLDRAANSQVMEGGRGYVTAYTGIRLLDIPVSTDRSAGDVHIFGNPHVTTDPLRTIQVARNITTGLKRVAPDRAAIFDAGLQRFIDRVHEKVFGERLVQMVGGATLEQLALNGGLFKFLEEQQFEGHPLLSDLGGWLAQATPFRGKSMICYHKNWAYFEERFQVKCADYVEAKPGIPPTPGHVAQLIERMKNEHLNVLFAASHFDRSKVEAVAMRGGAKLVQVPMMPGARAGVNDYFTLVDTWVTELAAAFSAR